VDQSIVAVGSMGNILEDIRQCKVGSCVHLNLSGIPACFKAAITVNECSKKHKAVAVVGAF